MPLRPERSEWVGELAELTRQIAAHELPDGCLHPVYEALTVAINQLVHRNQTGCAGRQYSFTPHPPLIGREQHITDQLDTTTGGTPAAADRADGAYYRAQRRAAARMKRRFPTASKTGVTPCGMPGSPLFTARDKHGWRAVS